MYQIKIVVECSVVVGTEPHRNHAEEVSGAICSHMLVSY